MNKPTVDPVADVLLDFQSVMAQFLELQTDVMSALAGRRPRVLAAPAPPPPPAPVEVRVAEARAAEPRETGPVETPEPVDQAAFSRYTLTVRERPMGDPGAVVAPGHAVVLTDDGRGVADLVAERLRGSGCRVAIVAASGSADRARDVFVCAVDSLDEAEADRLARQIAGACGPVGALIHLAPLAVAPPFELDVWDAALWERRLSSETRALFLLARSFGASLEHAAGQGGAAFIAATSMGGAFGVRPGEPALLPSQGGVAGFMKCAAIEWPQVRVRAVDLDPAEPVAALAAHVIAELWSRDSHVEVGYCGGTRVGIEAVRSPAHRDPSFAVPSDAVILATGGARGITAEVCLELAERYQPTFVLVGQSPLPPPGDPADVAALKDGPAIKRALTTRLQAGGAKPTPAMVEKAYRQLVKEREIRDTLSRLSAAGARTHYVQLDVQDADAFGALIDGIYDTYGRLDGVIHGAGIIEDKLVRDKSVESFDRVFRTKAISAFVLSRRLKPESLKFLVFFSSVAGRFGNRGQSDYAAANEVVSKLAGVLQQTWPARVCAIAWAPWDKLGMVSPELKREFSRRGVELLSPAAGRRALWQEIQQGPSAGAEVVVGGHAATPLAAEAARNALPLLAGARRESAQADAVRFVRHLDLSVDRYLRDHRLDGRPVLPLAFATEFMAEAAQAAFPELRVAAVRGLQLLKGIVVEPVPGELVEIVVTARGAVHSNADGSIDVDVNITTPALVPPMRYRAVVQMAPRQERPPAFDVPAWPLAPLSKPLDKAYRDWTFHGPLFQAITQIAGMGAGSIVGTIYSSSASPALSGPGRPSWIIDPFVFDSALQLLLMWSRAHNDMTALPSRFGAFRTYGELTDVPVTCYVAVESLAGGHALKSDVHFVDSAGRVLAILEGMEASCTSALNRLAVDVDVRVEGRP